MAQSAIIRQPLITKEKGVFTSLGECTFKNFNEAASSMQTLGHHGSLLVTKAGFWCRTLYETSFTQWQSATSRNHLPTIWGIHIFTLTTDGCIASSGVDESRLNNKIFPIWNALGRLRGKQPQTAVQQMTEKDQTQVAFSPQRFENGGNYRSSFSKINRNCCVLSGGFRGFSTMKQRSGEWHKRTSL